MYNPMNDPIIDVDAIAVGVEAAYQEAELAIATYKAPDGIGTEGLVDSIKEGVSKFFEMVKKFFKRVLEFFFPKDKTAKRSVVEARKGTLASIKRVDNMEHACREIERVFKQLRLDDQLRFRSKEEAEAYFDYSSKLWLGIFHGMPPAAAVALLNPQQVKNIVGLFNKDAREAAGVLKSHTVTMAERVAGSSKERQQIDLKKAARYLQTTFPNMISGSAETDEERGSQREWNGGMCSWETYFSKWPRLKGEFYKEMTPLIDSFKESKERIEKAESTYSQETSDIAAKVDSAIAGVSEGFKETIDSFNTGKYQIPNSIGGVAMDLAAGLATIRSLLDGAQTPLKDLETLEEDLVVRFKDFDRAMEMADEQMRSDTALNLIGVNGGKLNFTGTWMREIKNQFQEYSVLFRKWASLVNLIHTVYADVVDLERGAATFLKSVSTSRVLRSTFDGIEDSQKVIADMLAEYEKVKKATA